MSTDRDHLIFIAAWARGHAGAKCRDGVSVEHDGCCRALELADDLELIAGRLRS